MSETVVTVRDVVDHVQRHLQRVILPAIVFGFVGWFISGFIAPRYKSKAVLNIQSSYFRNPLVSELIPEVTDPAELSAQRQSLFRLALDDEFLDSLGRQFNVYKFPPLAPERAEERAEFLKTIEYFAVNPTTFQISGLAASGDDAARMVTRIVEQVTQTLVAERYTSLLRARDAIATQVKFLSRALRELNVGAGVLQPEYLEGELRRVDEQIALLRKRFTETHPEVFRLKGKEAEIRGALERGKRRMADMSDEVSAFVTPTSKAPVQDIYNDLLKKLSHLNIVLSMEKDRENVSYLAVLENPTVPLVPFSPKRLLIALGGVVFGLVVGLGRAVYIEYRRHTELTPERGAQALGVPMLGELSALDRASPLMLGSDRVGETLALPR